MIWIYRFDFVSFNTREMTLDFSRSIVRGTIGLGYEVQVISKGSSDSFSSRLKMNQIRELRSSLLRRTLGSLLQTNLLVESPNGRHVLLLNPDAVVLDNAIGRLISLVEKNPEIGIGEAKALCGWQSE